MFVLLNMTYIDELNKLPDSIKSQIRKLQNIKTKIINCKWSQIFNSICLKENLLPNYTRMRYHDPALEYSNISHNYKVSVIKREIKLKEENYQRLQSDKNKQISVISENNVNCHSVLTRLDTKLENSESVQKTNCKSYSFSSKRYKFRKNRNFSKRHWIGSKQNFTLS